MGDKVGSLSQRVVMCVLMWQCHALGQAPPTPTPARDGVSSAVAIPAPNAEPTPPPAPTSELPREPVAQAPLPPVAQPFAAPVPMCSAGWEQPFEQAQTAAVWIETYFANGAGVLLTKDLV